MGSLPSVTAKRMVRILESHGFRQARQKGTSRMLLKHPDGRRTVVAMHSRDLPKGTLYKILKDTGLSVDDLTR